MTAIRQQQGTAGVMMAGLIKVKLVLLLLVTTERLLKSFQGGKGNLRSISMPEYG